MKTNKTSHDHVLYLTVSLLQTAVYEDTYEKIKFKVEREEKARGKLHPHFYDRFYLAKVINSLLRGYLLHLALQNLWICLQTLKNLLPLPCHRQWAGLAPPPLSSMRCRGSTSGRTRTRLKCMDRSPANRWRSGRKEGEHDH